MEGYEFFIPVMFLGLVLLGFGGLAGINAWRIRQYQHWDVVERTGLRWLLEMSGATIFFAMIPFPLFYLLNDGAWRLGSLLLAFFLSTMILRAMMKSQQHQAHWPVLLVSLLVLSGILLTIEVVNIFWWSSVGVYAMGLTWVFILSGIQFIVFIIYERNPIPQPRQVFTVDHTTHHNRVQRDDTANHPNGTAYGHSYVYRDPIKHARRQRYANRYPNSRQS